MIFHPNRSMRALALAPALALALLAALPAPAKAVSEGRTCEGTMVLYCLPLVAVDKAAQKVLDAGIRRPTIATVSDLDEVRQSMATASAARREALLHATVADYFAGDDDDKARFDIVRYLVGERVVDVTGPAGTLTLQRTVADPAAAVSPERHAAKVLKVARLLVANGARAGGVHLGACVSCDPAPELLALLVAHGAAPDDVGTEGRALLNELVVRGRLKPAARLLDLGADPNGQVRRHAGMLETIAGGCDRDLLRRIGAREVGDAEWRDCMADTQKLAAFAIGHGADPNGQAAPFSDCRTPYRIARAKGNHVLAEALLALGASPDAPANCRPAAPVARL